MGIRSFNGILFVGLFFLLLLSGCGGPLKHKASKDFFTRGIKTVAVLPVIFENSDITDVAERGKISGILLKNAVRGLSSRGYSAVSLDDVNAEFEKALIANKKNGSAAELVKGLKAAGVDAFLIVRISEWETSVFAPRASFKAVSEYYLVSGDGTVVWSARYKDNETDYRLDKETLEFGVVKVYEARLEKSSAMVFAMLPEAPLAAPSDGSKGYFDWLK